MGPSGLMLPNENKRIKQALLNKAVTSCSCGESQRVTRSGGTAGNAVGGAGGWGWELHGG